MSKMTRHLPALLLAGVAIASPACAARVYETGYPRASYPPPPHAAYVSFADRNGFRDGVDAGRDAARHHDRYDPERERRYRDGDHDYDRRYGPRDDYRRDYRAAFERGYRDGYDAVRRDDRRWDDRR
jgi:hypothetical protein